MVMEARMVASGRSKLPTIVHRKTFWVMGNVLYPNFGDNYIGIYNCKNETEPLRFIHFIVCKLYIVLKKNFKKCREREEKKDKEEGKEDKKGRKRKEREGKRRGEKRL